MRKLQKSKVPQLKQNPRFKLPSHGDKLQAVGYFLWLLRYCMAWKCTFIPIVSPTRLFSIPSAQPIFTEVPTIILEHLYRMFRALVLNNNTMKQTNKKPTHHFFLWRIYANAYNSGSTIISPPFSVNKNNCFFMILIKHKIENRLKSVVTSSSIRTVKQTNKQILFDEEL